MANYRPLVAFLTIGICLTGQTDSAPYYGKLIGKLSELHHGVSGEVYAVDGRTLYIKDFTYDGQGPAAYFYASHQKGADKNGFRLRDENGNGEVIRRYRKEGITLTLPDGKNLNSVKIFYLWCEEFDVNFGDVKIPRNFDYPKPQKIDALKGVHAVSSDNVVIVDAQTLLIPNLSYDGEAPDAKFWVGRGSKPTPQGIRVPDENGKETPLRRYDRKTVVLTLPGDLTIFDIGHFGIWCEAFTVDFGHVLIPQSLNIPPSLKMLGVSPQKQNHHQVDVQVSQSRPLVGGHLRPTTYRPPTALSFFTRRSDATVGHSNQINPTQGTPNSIQRSIEPAAFNQARPQQIVQPFPQYIQLQPQIIHPQRNFIQPQQLFYQPFGQIQSFPQSIGHQRQSVIIQPSQQLQQFAFNPYNNQHQPRQILRQESQVYQQQIPYTHQIPRIQPLNNNQRQLEEQQGYNQYLQMKRLQEEQLQQQLSRQYNRFNLGNNNQNAYVPLG